jgi:putative PIN family toxin of toxin-antitoxin system
VSPFDRPPIVVDTNVLISAMLFDGSTSAKALNKALTQYVFVQSEATLNELASTVRRKKFDKYKPLGEREQFLLTIARASKIVDITCTVNDCRDPKDNRFLELALSACSTLIVSGDDDLLSMNPYKGVSVVNPSAFLTGL